MGKSVEYRVPRDVLGVSLVSDTLGLGSLFLSLLASTFILGSPICLSAGIGFLSQSVLEARSSKIFGQLVLAVSLVIVLTISTLLNSVHLPRLSVFKAAIGAILFLFTLILAPDSLQKISSRYPTALVLIGLLIVTSFAAEYLGIFSMKAAGLVQWYENSGMKAQIDFRPSGLYSEPSWHALAASSLAYYLSKSKSWTTRLTAVLLLGSSLLSGSSTGLAMSGLIILRLTVFGSRRPIAVLGSLALILFAATAFFLLPTSLDLEHSGQIQKLLNPTGYGSGVSRFVDPLFYLGQTLSAAPLMGMGLAYINERLIGNMGAAILPLNVFIECGFFGLLVYVYFILYSIRAYRSNFIDILGVILCLGSLGLEGSPFQAILLVFFITPWSFPCKSPIFPALRS